MSASRLWLGFKRYIYEFPANASSESIHSAVQSLNQSACLNIMIARLPHCWCLYVSLLRQQNWMKFSKQHNTTSIYIYCSIVHAGRLFVRVAFVSQQRQCTSSSTVYSTCMLCAFYIYIHTSIRSIALERRIDSWRECVLLFYRASARARFVGDLSLQPFVHGILLHI